MKSIKAESFNDILNKYNTPVSPSYIEPKLSVHIGDVTKTPNGPRPGEVCIDSSSGKLFVGDLNGGLTTAPIGVVSSRDIDDMFDSIIGTTKVSNPYVTTTTTYTQSIRSFEIPDGLNTKDLIFIKDKIENGYSYIKIKNFDELRQAFRRLGCYVTEHDVSTIANIGVFPLPNGKYVVIN